MCSTCRFFQAPNRCAIVSEQGPPDDGEINPAAWCALWVNRDDDAPFSWLSSSSSLTVNGRTFPIAYTASTPEERRAGLMGRPVTGGTLMLFVFPTSDYHSFWTYNVGSPVDILWLDSKGAVVDVVRNAPPCTDPQRCPIYTPSGPASYGIEAGAGFADANGIAVGSLVSLS